MSLRWEKHVKKRKLSGWERGYHFDRDPKGDFGEEAKLMGDARVVYQTKQTQRTWVQSSLWMLRITRRQTQTVWVWWVWSEKFAIEFENEFGFRFGFGAKFTKPFGVEFGFGFSSFLYLSNVLILLILHTATIGRFQKQLLSNDVLSESVFCQKKGHMNRMKGCER